LLKCIVPLKTQAHPIWYWPLEVSEIKTFIFSHVFRYYDMGIRHHLEISMIHKLWVATILYIACLVVSHNTPRHNWQWSRKPKVLFGLLQSCDSHNACSSFSCRTLGLMQDFFSTNFGDATAWRGYWWPGTKKGS
jgi:hypothetical protein